MLLLLSSSSLLSPIRFAPVLTRSTEIKPWKRVDKAFIGVYKGYSVSFLYKRETLCTVGRAEPIICYDATTPRLPSI